MTSEYPPGTPIWVDLATPDIAAARAFYTELFGWTAEVTPEPEAGGYTIFTREGKAVAGAGPLMGEGQPVVWSTYVSTSDADATTARVEEAGGKVLLAPFDVMDQGRMAVFLDRSGAAFSVWEPRAMGGAELFNVPGAVCWNELATREPDDAKQFYRAVFGWEADDSPMRDVIYTVWQLDGRPIGGMIPMAGDQWPAEIPPHWMVYFSVEDCDAAATRVTALGGAVPVPPTDIPVGRFAVVNDPHGAHFSLLQSAPT